MSAELRRRLATLVRPLTRTWRRWRYRRRLARGEAAGDFVYVWSEWRPPASWRVEARLREHAATSADAARWCRRQTLRELCVTGFRDGGEVAWRVDRDGPLDPEAIGEAPWFYAPGELGELPPVHLEACLLVTAAEDVDAVVMQLPDTEAAGLATAADAVGDAGRSRALFRSTAYDYLPAEDAIRPAADTELIKMVEPRGVAALPKTADYFGRRRRGPYLSSVDLEDRLEVEVRDAARLPRTPRGSDLPALMVTTSFLARGGAEHTLFETLRYLRNRFEIAIVTLAPHRPPLGDRRADFAAITPRIYCLGDWVHPAAMPGILASLLDATGAEILYNANSTTLFYDFVPRLKAERPALRIVDHLYDHRVGYVERYSEELLATVDACVAENRRIAAVLVEECGWPPQRVPMIHPCGRLQSAFPSGDEADATRRRLRRELGFAAEDLVILTAARMHPQKRPLDLVALAVRVRDLDQVRFVIAGGGELEGEVDAAIARSGARIVRLPFRDDVPELIVAADAGCLVSEYEGLPVFMMECLQAGRPFLGTDVGEMGALLRDTGAGLIVDRPGDLDALEDRVRRLADPAVRAELAERARAAGHGFEVETCAERYAEVFLGKEG
ncbi:MAG: glycosyltransferase family 4 protein [Thermoanaerobaculia bacterium]